MNKIDGELYPARLEKALALRLVENGQLFSGVALLVDCE